MYNKDLLLDIRRWAREEQKTSPTKLTMRAWVEYEDGRLAAACLGGWLVHQAGAEFIWSRLPGEDREHARSCRIDGVIMSVSEAAIRLLGVTDEEAHVLFDLQEEEQGDEDRALDFLDVLVERAEQGLPSMTEEEISSWCNEWAGGW